MRSIKLSISILETKFFGSEHINISFTDVSHMPRWYCILGCNVNNKIENLRYSALKNKIVFPTTHTVILFLLRKDNILS